MADRFHTTLHSEPHVLTVPVPESELQEQPVAGVHVIQQVSRFHSGPLPDPEDLSTYAELIPNGAERIMALVEREATHRQEQDEQLIASEIRQITRAQWMAFAVTLALAAAGVYLGVTGHDWLAAALFTTTIGAVVTTFVVGNGSAAKQ